MVFNICDDINNWKKKGTKATDEEIQILINASINYRDDFFKDYKNYLTAKTILKNYSYLVLIDIFLEKLKNYLTDEGKVLISDVPKFLSAIAQNNESSFIYEKIGTNYNNFLLDEFQDTSNMQWESIFPLINDSDSQNNRNIIVGDLKQSIYAWRGGDWELMANLNGNLNFLEDNWRSGKTIVEFNNDFFEKAKNILLNELSETFSQAQLQNIEKIYSQIKQNPKNKNDSIVEINVFEKGMSEKPDFKKAAIQNLISKIEEIQIKGFAASDILILVRSKAEATLIAEKILEYSQTEAKPNICYDVVSAEALLLSSNNNVQLIISVLRWLSDNNDNLALTEITYFNCLNSHPLERVGGGQETDCHANAHDNIFDFTNKKQIEITKEKLFKIKNSSKQLLYEIVEEIIYQFQLNKMSENKNVSFLIAFREMIHNFELNYSTSYKEFLNYWEEKESKEVLNLPEKQNAINILTIHKAKGLEADFVFIPFCNWELDKSGDLKLLKIADEAPFNKLPIFPVIYKQELKDTWFSDDYLKIHFKNIIESFNMLYVAFTRAKKGLFVYCDEKPENSKSFNKVNLILHEILN